MKSPTFLQLPKARHGAVSALSLILTLLPVRADLLSQGAFETWSENTPAGWTKRTQQTCERGSGPDGAASLKVINTAAVPGKSGEIVQEVVVKPNTEYVLEGQVRSDIPGGAAIQVKRLLEGREAERISSAKSPTSDWSPATVRFNSGASQSVLVLLRWRQEAEDVGKAAEFARLRLEEYVWKAPDFEEVPPHAVATYNCLGLYWKPKGGSPQNPVTVHYRKKGGGEWREALPLWFDATEHAGEALAHSYEYRGSIVGLEPGTAYEVKLALQGGPEKILEATTRSDAFKIARRVSLPNPGALTHTISEGGSAEEGYVLYEPSDSTEAWDGGGTAPQNLKVTASHVILKGFTLKNAAAHGILLGEVRDVVIDGCDISGWGETRPDGQAKDLDAAIFASSPNLERITIQNCHLHHPRSDSNSWAEERPGTKSTHPAGPQGIVFRNGKGGHVIRFNRITSDLDHMFNDSMGDTNNFSYGGFPVCDSDIHDNLITHCWDDGMEIEGADMNVRVWNNYIDTTYGAIGAASPSLGPLYLFRNVYAVSRKHSGTADNDFRGHYLVKLGNERSEWTKGRMYIFHNTTLQPPPFPGASTASSGAQSGIVFTSPKKLQENIVTRNNLLQMRTPADWAIRDTQRTPSNDFDYDMFDGQTMFRDGSQTHGVKASPTFRRTADGRLALVPGTPGHDAGVRLPNFNDGFAGQAPDLGAVETDGTDSKPVTWPNFPEPHGMATSAPVPPPAPAEKPASP